VFKNLSILVLTLIALSGCNDKGEKIREAQVNPEDGMILVKRFKTPPKLSYRYGQDVCFGFWTFQIYKRCDHRLHGVKADGLTNDLRTHLIGFRADSIDEAKGQCESYVKEYELPLGVEFKNAEVTHRGATVYDCFATRSVVATREMRSPYCGIEKNLDLKNKDNLPEDLQILADLDFLELQDETHIIAKKGLINIQKYRQLTGITNFKCSTCDDLPVYTHKNLIDKFICLMDKYLSLEKDSVYYMQNKIKREVRNFNKTTKIAFDPNQGNSEEEDLLNLLDEEDAEDESEEVAEVEDEVISNPELEEESEESKKERELKESHKQEVMNGLSCLKKYYSELLLEEQVAGIARIEKKYNVICNERAE